MKGRIFLLLGAAAALIVISMAIHRQTNPEDYLPEPKPQPPPKPTSPATFEPTETVTVKTKRGVFKFVLFGTDMPITRKNFVDLAKKGFYKGLKFHRVEDWVVQGGDPKGNGSGGSGKTIKFEVRPGLGFEKPYTVGMARRQEVPDSASSQFFVTKRSAPEITGMYAAFGRVFKGQEVVDKLKKGDEIQELTVSPVSGQDIPRIMQIEKVKPDEQRAKP